MLLPLRLPRAPYLLLLLLMAPASLWLLLVGLAALSLRECLPVPVFPRSVLVLCDNGSG